MVLVRNHSFFEFITDGVWCWFQDRRSIVDTIREKLIIGTANMSNGIDLTVFDIKSNNVESSDRFTFSEKYHSDDHNSPGLCIAPNGNYIASWSLHHDRYYTRYSIYDERGWSPVKLFDWTKIPGGTNFSISYSNVYYLSQENRLYNFVRSNDRSPNFIYSDDNGYTWEYGGQITTNDEKGYTKGYYKFWSNGIDRIDIVLTEKHPREGEKETGTNIYHGYIKGHKMYNTEDNVIDNDIYDRSTIPSHKDFTKVFVNGTKVNGISMYRCWQHDIVRYDDNSIAILFKARANDDPMDHRHFYARYDGSHWVTSYIGKAGESLYEREEDYTGLGTLCPNDPDKVYISTPHNPENDLRSEKHEIWKGVTRNKGVTWNWEAITSDSKVDNIRPIVPVWEKGKEVLLWVQGTYNSFRDVDTKIVGLIYRKEQNN